MKLKTKLTKISRDPKKDKGYINPGIYKGSTIIFNDFKSYIKDRDQKDNEGTGKYGIQFNPTTEKFENAITTLYEWDALNEVDTATKVSTQETHQELKFEENVSRVKLYYKK